MNHLGDTNKKVSDTPRMNAARNAAMEHMTGDVWRVGCQLERELNAANQRIKRLDEFVDQLTNPKFTRDYLPKEALLQRIKRLEKAGDAMFLRSTRVGREIWRKAKEDKLSVNPIQSLGANLMKAGIGFTTEDKP